jgi:hypothetical protein
MQDRHRAFSTAKATLAPVRSLVVLAALVAATAAHASTPPSDAEYHKLCRAITPTRVRALFTAPIAPIQLGGSQDCAFFPRGGNALVNGVRVFLRIDDGDQTLWKHRGDHPYGTFRSLVGIAAHAKWATSPAGFRRSSMPDTAPSHAR